jgi:hypothetical protein
MKKTGNTAICEKCKRIQCSCKAAPVSDSPELAGCVPLVKVVDYLSGNTAKVVKSIMEGGKGKFELVQLHECHGYAEVVVRAKNGKRVYAGNITLEENPNDYYST